MQQGAVWRLKASAAFKAKWKILGHKFFCSYYLKGIVSKNETETQGAATLCKLGRNGLKKEEKKTQTVLPLDKKVMSRNIMKW